MIVYKIMKDSELVAETESSNIVQIEVGKLARENSYSLLQVLKVNKNDKGDEKVLKTVLNLKK